MVRFAFQEVQYYLYTDLPPRVNTVNCLPVLELANRFVLPRLINLIERSIIDQMINSDKEVFIEVLELLQPSQVQTFQSNKYKMSPLQFLQVFNAIQLSQWCLSYIGQNYKKISSK